MKTAICPSLLEACSGARLRQLFSGYDGVFLFEAQSVTDVSAALKLLVDLLPHLRVIVTGSSAFRLDQIKSFVLFRISGFSRNLRKEVSSDGSLKAFECKW